MIIGAIISAAAAVTEVLSTLYLGVQGIKLIANLLTSLAKMLGLVEESNPEQLGDKALQAEEAGITPETCSTYEEYLEKVEKFEIDPIASKKYTEEQKVLKGAELSAGIILESFPEIPVQTFVETVDKKPEFFTADWIKACTDTVADSEDLELITGYISETEKNTEKLDSATDMLVKIEKALDSTISDDQAFRNVVSGERM